MSDGLGLTESLTRLLETLKAHGVTHYEGPIVALGLNDDVKLTIDPFAARLAAIKPAEKPEEKDEAAEEVDPVDGLTKSQKRAAYSQE